MKRVLSFLPVTAFVLLVVIISSAALISSRAALPARVIATPQPFEPITTDGLRMVTTGTIHMGQMVTLQNGVCNTSDDSYSFTYTFGIRQAGDPLASRFLELAGSSPQPLDPGCWRQAPFDLPLPEIVTPGVWQYYATVTVMGSQAGQIQRLSLSTQAFTVVER